MRKSKISDLQWHQLPADGGQIVDVTYAVDVDYLYRRRHDRSDSTTTIERAELDCDVPEEAAAFEPWNGDLPDHGEWEATDDYTVEMRDEQCCETVTIEADDLDDARDQAEEETRDWIEGGVWGDSGASIVAYWRLIDSCGEEVDSGSVTVEIEPDHDALIRAAGGDPDCDHDWTAEGDGGCRENPGVWSTGGTSMTFAAHCRKCGLHRVEHSTGSQRNPGEHDTVVYEQPESWCADCESEDCSC